MTDITIAGARIHRTSAQITHGDLYTHGPVLTAQRHKTADEVVIDGSGASVVPLFVSTVFIADAPPSSNAFDLIPDNPATFAVVDGIVGPEEIQHMLVVQPEHLRAVIVDGELVVRDGAAVRAPGASLDPSDPRLTAWTDRRRDMTQHLMQDGRYSETRGGIPDAYTGAYWVDGARITYLDDSGFWAFGQFFEDRLHHAGFVLRRL